MPFSKKLAFVRQELPDDVPDTDYVFYCGPTDEAFVHYEDFCERVIQCNSLIWTDTISGKSDLTYLEATESEEKSITVLQLLPHTLHIPMLYLASIAESPSFEALVDDVYRFIKDRFFMGEMVSFITLHDEIWREGVVSRVIAPSAEEVEDIRSSVELLDGGNFFPPPSLYLYEVESYRDGGKVKSIISIPLLRRPTGVVNKEFVIEFLEHLAMEDEDKWTVERGVLEKFGIINTKFCDFYAGETPVFPVSKIMQESTSFNDGSISFKKHASPRKKSGGIVKKSKSIIKDEKTHVKTDRKRAKISNTTENVNNKMKLQQTDIKNFFISSKDRGETRNENNSEESSDDDDDDDDVAILWSPNNSSQMNSPRKPEKQAMLGHLSDVSPSCSGVVPKQRVSGHESAMFKKRKQMRITGDGQLEGIKRSKTIVKSRHDFTLEKAREEEKLRRERREQEILEGFKLHEERLKMKAKNEEEKLQFAKFMKEWRKKREDLECEDLKPLPVPNKVYCSIPNHLFGEFVMVLEFFHSFHDFLKVKSYIPGGITFEILERALIETEIAGPLIDILYVLLSAIFELQIAEHETPKTGIPISVDLNLEDLYSRKMTFQEAIPLCIAASGWSDTFQGLPLSDIELNPLSVTEVLRLHLLGSGGRAWDTNSRWLSQRGGHTNFDDPGLWLRVEQTTVLLCLSHKHVCQMSAEDKLTILSCLMNQILTYARVRDILDERGEQSKQAKADVRAVEIAELKLQKEATAKRMQNKREAKLLRLQGESQKPNLQLLKHEKDAEIEKTKMEKEITKLKMDIQKKHSKVLPLIMSHQLHPIGCDRAHRNFWMFATIPGLFVEYNPFELGTCLPQPTPVRNEDRGDIETHVRKLFEEGLNCSSDKENDIGDSEIMKPMNSPNKKMLGEQNVSLDQSNSNMEEKEPVSSVAEEKEFLVCTASSKCPVHCHPISRSYWSFFSNPEDVGILIESLNERGVRESELRRFIIREQDRIKESVSLCPLHKLNVVKFVEQESRKSSRNAMNYKTEIVNMNHSPNTPIEKIMESHLRESILQMENKLTLGCLGVLKVHDRLAWRTAIENGSYDKQCDKLTWGFRRHSSPDKDLKEKDQDNQDSGVDDSQEVKDESEFSNHDNSSEKSDELTEDNDKEINEEIEGEIDAEEFPSKDIHKWGGTDDDGYTTVKFVDEHHLTNGNQDNEDDDTPLECDSVKTSEFESDSAASVNNATQNSDSELNHDSLPKEVNSLNETLPLNSEKNSQDNTVIDKEVDETEDMDDVDNKQVVDTNVSQLPPPRDPTIRDLACAILQLGQSVDPKFLLQPLAGSDDSRKQMKYWEVSLMNTINFSQLFIHHLTLDRSINWSKSILRAPCRICRRRGEPQSMITCADCNKRYHYACTKPKVAEMPEGEWYCPYCTKDADPWPLKHERQSKRKRKREVEKTKRNEVLLNNSPERKSAKMECNKCGVSDNTLVHCCSCCVAFHADCLDPPLRASRRQKENWQCYSCKPPKDFGLLDAASNCDPAVQDDCAVPVRERRVCTSATIAKIASFAKKLRSCSWDDDGETSSHFSENSRDYESSREYSPSSSMLRDNSPIRRSSRRADCISEYLPLDNAVLQNLLDEMIHHKDSWPFLRPVRKSEVPDYHLYIKKPMDLGTIKYKLNTAEYKNNHDFVADALLVFENCFMYNSSQTAVYKCGTAMLQFFKKRCQELGLLVNWNAHN